MVDGVSLSMMMRDELDECELCVDKMPQLGSELAEAERKYREAKHKRIAYERARNNTPVSIIQDIVKGYEDIAQLALERDMAQTVYDANHEALMLHKKKADILRDIYIREYGRNDGM